MKNFTLVSLYLLFVVVIPITAQNAAPKPVGARIALVNPYAFEDRVKGIKRLTSAWDDIGSTDFAIAFELSDKIQQVESLGKEILNTNISLEIRQAKQKQIEELNKRIEDIGKLLKTYQTRINVLVEPVLDDINKQVKLIAEQNNVVIFDGTELEKNGQLVAFNKNLDITYSIIPAINDFYKTKSKPNLNLNLPESKIAVINTNTFINEQSGIKQFVEKVKEYEKRIRLETGRNPTTEEITNRIWQSNAADNNIGRKIWSSAQSFADEKGFNIIFDSSKKLPNELERFQIKDVTKDFISYFNQSNPRQELR